MTTKEDAPCWKWQVSIGFRVAGDPRWFGGVAFVPWTGDHAQDVIDPALVERICAIAIAEFQQDEEGKARWVDAAITFDGLKSTHTPADIIEIRCGSRGPHEDRMKVPVLDFLYLHPPGPRNFYRPPDFRLSDDGLFRRVRDERPGG